MGGVCANRLGPEYTGTDGVTGEVIVRQERPGGILSGKVCAIGVPMTADMAPSSEFLMYETEDGKARIECRFAEETL